MALPLERFLQNEQKRPNELFLSQATPAGTRTWSYKQAGDDARRMAHAFTALGLMPGDKIALLSKNCAEWIIADMAMMMGGFVSVPLYASITAPTIRMLLEHSGSKLVIVGKLDNFKEQAAGIVPDVPSIYIEAYGQKGTITWEQLLKKHQPISDIQIPDRDSLQTIMYTSGTTGKPKGVMHSFGTIEATLHALLAVGVPMHPRAFSYLPLSHIAERMGIEMLTIYLGGSIFFANSLDSFAVDLQNTSPHVFFAVPRLWAKFREKINEKLPEKKLNTLLKIPIISSLVKKKIKKGLGLTDAAIIISGAAPISIELLEWYKKVGVQVLQAYAMTEDCVFGHFNLPHANKLGTVGKPLPGLSVRIAEDGEIQVKSAGLMLGYYREPEITAEVFTPDGYLKTGDQGMIDAQGFLTITGRLKDQFKTDKGKYISPSAIEMRITDHQFVEQCCVVGMGIPQPIALIILSEIGQTIAKSEVQESLKELIHSINVSLEPHEKLETAVVLSTPWTIENGLLTPTLKVKRNEVEKIYQTHYSRWFHEQGQVVFNE